ncbi:S8 family peptidase [Baekduia sp. Peel2402]|uniref:S8 family peptidase n=1 Tax=Baekduia sp. Peel2402 TaxID=3458296 RepID=UPI00403ED5FF
MRRRVAIAVRVAAAVVTGAGAAIAAGWAGPASPAFGAALALPSAGFCVPAPTDATYVPRALGAVALAANGVATEPIAILDTGVDPDAPQLAGRVLPGWDAATGAPVSGDWDGHGTSAAGLAASAGAGMAGVSPGSPILPVRIYAPGARTAALAVVAKGIELAVARGAGVVVVEGSVPAAGASDDEWRALVKAVDAAFAKGVIVVTGMGDDTLPDANLPSSLPHVLTAGAATATPSRSAPVNTGPWLDLLVPGEGVTAPLPLALCPVGFGFATGSSFAAPALGGAVALVQASRPTLTTQQLFEVIRRAGTDLGTGGRDDDSGYGLLSLPTALSAAPLAKDTSVEPDDDPYWVRSSAYVKKHPALLTKTKMRFKATGTVSPAKDPADVYRVSLLKRERLVVNVSAADPNALLELAILDPRVESFDVTDDVAEWALVATGGLSSDPQLEITAARSGTFYIAVTSAPAVDPDDAAQTAAEVEPYTLSAYKQRKKAKAKAKK